MKSHIAECGIKHILTTTYTPEQNEVAERMNQTLVKLIRFMLHDKNLPKSLWAEALTAAVYVWNRVTSHALSKDITPYYIWEGRAP